MPHEVLWTALTFFHVPEGIAKLVKANVQDIPFSMATFHSAAAQQPLEVSMMAGCTMSPRALTVAMKLITGASA